MMATKPKKKRLNREELVSLATDIFYTKLQKKPEAWENNMNPFL